jgi:hypothetical protein
MDDNQRFSNAIAELYHNRERLERLSINCREKTSRDFNVKNTARRYHELFINHKQLNREKKIRKIKVGARLDHPLIPSPITKFIRTLLK